MILFLAKQSADRNRLISSTSNTQLNPFWSVNQTNFRLKNHDIFTTTDCNWFRCSIICGENVCVRACVSHCHLALFLCFVFVTRLCVSVSRVYISEPFQIAIYLLLSTCTWINIKIFHIHTVYERTARAHSFTSLSIYRMIVILASISRWLEWSRICCNTNPWTREHIYKWDYRLSFQLCVSPSQRCICTLSS